MAPKKGKILPGKWIRGRWIEPEEFIIDVSPPSSPESSDSDSDSDLESIEDIEELSLDNPEASSSTGPSASAAGLPVSSTSQVSQSQEQIEKRSPFAEAVSKCRAAFREHFVYAPQYHEHMTKSEKACNERLKKEHQKYREQILEYLRHNTVTLEDVKAYTPELNELKEDIGLTDKMASNIAYNYAGGRISESSMAAIRWTLFTAAQNYRLFHLVDEKYEEYHKGMEDKELSKAILRRKEKKAKAVEAKNLKQPTPKHIREEIKKFPAHMQVRPDMPDLLPAGATTVAQMYVEVYGFTWEQTRDLIINSNNGSAPKAYHLLPRERDPIDFAGTKAQFNFRGRWREKKHDKIVLPPKDAYKGRRVRNTVNPLIRQSKEPGRTFASTRTMYDTIYENHIDGGKGKKMVVKLPPIKTLESAPSANASPEPADLIMPLKDLTLRSEVARLTFTTENTLHEN